MNTNKTKRTEGSTSNSTARKPLYAASRVYFLYHGIKMFIIAILLSFYNYHYFYVYKISNIINPICHFVLNRYCPIVFNKYTHP